MARRGKQQKRVALHFSVGRRPRLDRAVKACCLCGGVAFRLVGRAGYCEAHTAEAFAAQRATLAGR